MTRPADLDYIEELKARVEQLEAALREIRDLPRVSYAAAAQVMAEIARVALASEQDAGIGCGRSVIEPWNAPEQKK
jgi:hypothetical protein